MLEIYYIYTFLNYPHMETKEASKLGFILASKYRVRIMMALKENAKTPKQLCDELSLLSEQVSRTLKELQERELVKCLNPKARKGRLYDLTPLGRKILSKMEEK